MLDIDKYFSKINKTYFTANTHVVLNDMDKDLYYLLWSFQEKCDLWLSQNGAEVQEVFELYFKALDFLRAADYFDEHYAFYMEKSMVKLLCLDPSHMLSQTHSKLISEIFFSATLTLLNYFKEVLGGDISDYNFKLSSPFKKDNLLVLVNNQISTKYKDRDNSYEKIADCLNLMICAKDGNYFAFFSSYQYMMKVYDVFAQKYPCKPTTLQKPNMNEADREALSEWL